MNSPLGQFLFEQAKLVPPHGVIVEIGTGGGMGSTNCLMLGMKDQVHFLTVEADFYNFDDAKSFGMKMYPNLSVTYLHGVLHRMIKPYWLPGEAVKQHREMWEWENKARLNAPLVHVVHPVIDLLFLDGGEFTSDGDFLLLWDQAKVIVMDDTNLAKAVKNANNCHLLARAGWEVIADHPDNRNGWAAYRRPE